MSLRDWPILRQLCPDFFTTIRMAFVFGPTGNEALLIVSDYKIYGVGTNHSGCLGVGDKNSHPLPTEVISLTNKSIEGLACGGDFTNSGIFVVAYLHNGDIYQWGSIPHNTSSQCIITPQKLDTKFNWKVTALACGYAHCMILCDDGKVFTWGSNDYGQLGYSENLTHGYRYNSGSNTPRQVKGILNGKPAIDISCGGYFSVVLLHDGKLVTWGRNGSGQLGINSTTHSTIPVEVSALNKIEINRIACGPAHVLALSKSNVLYGWGCNSHSQLGFSNPSNAPSTFYTLPVELKKYCWQLRIINIGASYASNLSVAQCESKEIFMFGKLASGKILSKPTDSQCESIDQVFAFYASPNMMLKPMRHILEAKRRTTMLDTLESEFGNPDTSDLTILVGKNEIHVHQAILKMRSDYFKVLLARWSKNEKVVTIKKKSFIVINTYLKYLYTDKLEVDLNLAVESLLLADEYGDDNFKSLCERSIKRDMKADKVAEVFALTRKFKTCEDLNKFCLDFIINHAEEVVNTPGFKKWDVDTMTAVFIEYVKKKENC